MKRITIKDVAQKAQVSVATVSRVINNNYPVSDKTRHNVLLAINELNFQPNGIARSLKRNFTSMIGLVIPDITNPYFMSIGKGIESVVSKRGYVIILCNTDENLDKEINSLKILSEKRVDAIILTTSSEDNDHIKELINKGIPVVLVDRKIKGFNTDVVINDNFGSSYLLTKHIIQKGHRDICIVNGLLNVSTGKERFEGFKAAMEEHNIPIKSEFILNGNFNSKIAYNEVKKLLKNGYRPTAIIAANNLMAEGVMLAILEEKLSIPNDISLVAFEEIRNQELITPKVTYINQNGFLMGQKAGELVLEKINNNLNGLKRHGREIILVPDLVIRDSVKTLN
ncbi:LacI family DNA-binding transcriptional regulator [Thermoanaerobacterium thermosaccharolyticum]|uniref:LacI family DNA-binding transcriptional regulator n=1 Tax=Thermoanaerobacterium thermosaccharolyticum TaxID=1517 RepID=UPI0020A570B2|nr:LacI family DNA-binding transcriptional regulator [Thermoanaerobacterium thermosaccharolyticum]MCP2240322.1 LacI family transcriptional regulator [Thermoanaerobacterium thermosaccharolyticum]